MTNYLKKWVPIESNPETMNEMLSSFGVPTTWQFADCFSLDEELLSMIPQPCISFILLFPSPDREEEELVRSSSPKTEGVFFMRQLLDNACGTIAVIHSILNNKDILCLDEKSVLQEFYTDTKNLDPFDIGVKFANYKAIEDEHNAIAAQGQTEAPSLDEQVDYHFVCFTLANGNIYELDGMKPQPINHGPSSEETFTKDCATIIRNAYLTTSNGNINFSIITLGGSVVDE